MTSAQAILTGAVLIAASIFAVNGIRPAEAQKLSGGPYQLMHHSNTVANAGVFRLDTTSGEITYCYITGNSDLTCTHAVK
jgi:hypothetical protein